MAIQLPGSDEALQKLGTTPQVTIQQKAPTAAGNTSMQDKLNMIGSAVQPQQNTPTIAGPNGSAGSHAAADGPRLSGAAPANGLKSILGIVASFYTGGAAGAAAAAGGQALSEGEKNSANSGPKVGG